MLSDGTFNHGEIRMITLACEYRNIAALKGERLYQACEAYLFPGARVWDIKCPEVVSYIPVQCETPQEETLEAIRFVTGARSYLTGPDQCLPMLYFCLARRTSGHGVKVLRWESDPVTIWLQDENAGHFFFEVLKGEVFKLTLCPSRAFMARQSLGFFGHGDSLTEGPYHTVNPTLVDELSKVWSLPKDFVEAMKSKLTST